MAERMGQGAQSIFYSTEPRVEHFLLCARLLAHDALHYAPCSIAPLGLPHTFSLENISDFIY